MTFVSRPFLSNDQFRQSSDSILTLSGQTNIATTTGFTLTDGIGSDIIVTASGASNIGDVLTFDGSKIVLAPSSSVSDNQFLCGMTDITREPYVGLNMGVNTTNAFLEKLFFPPTPPSSTLSFTTSEINREFGDNTDLLCSTNTLDWSITKNTNTISQILIDYDGSGNYGCSITPTEISQSGQIFYSYDSNLPVPSPAVVSTSVTYGISGKTVSGETTNTTLISYWKGKGYCGISETNYVNESDSIINTELIDNSASSFITRGSKCFCNFDNGLTPKYFYYSYPQLFGCPTQIMVNGMPNNSWGNASIGTFTGYTRINQYNYEQPYYLIRSDNRITGKWNINITTQC